MIYFPAKSFCRSAGERLSTDHHLTTYLSGLFRRIIFTLPHSFMLTATSAGICAHRTNSRAVSLHIAECHSSPTPGAGGSNPPGRTKGSTHLGAAFFILYEILREAERGFEQLQRRPPPYVPAGKKPLRGFFRARRAQYPLRPHKTRTLLHSA